MYVGLPVHVHVSIDPSIDVSIYIYIHISISPYLCLSVSLPLAPYLFSHPLSMSVALQSSSFLDLHLSHTPRDSCFKFCVQDNLWTKFGDDAEKKKETSARAAKDQLCVVDSLRLLRFCVHDSTQYLVSKFAIASRVLE